MITTNVMLRTFLVKFGNSTGTAFTTEDDSRQYLATARHVVKGIKPRDAIHVFHDRQWKPLEVQVVGVGEKESDIAVLSPLQQLSPTLPLEATSEGLTYGQQLYFLGFPFGWDGGGGHISSDYPIPLVKSGILSAFIPGSPTKLYLDAHVNEGFSGGPVIFKEVPTSESPTPDSSFKVAGIVVNFPTPIIRAVIDSNGDQILDQNGNPIGIRENPGIVVAIDIKHAVDLIKQNPIGCPVRAGPEDS